MPQMIDPQIFTKVKAAHPLVVGEMIARIPRDRGILADLNKHLLIFISAVMHHFQTSDFAKERAAVRS
jgi:hypothetical protein